MNRQQAYLRERYRALVGYTGVLLVLVGASYLITLVMLIFYPQEWRLGGAWLLQGALVMGLGGFMWKRYAPAEPQPVSMQEGAVVVSLVWMFLILSGALPFMLVSDLNFHQAMFESTSTWTTTGLTVINVEEAPKLVLFYRSWIQFVGGAGLAILTLSAAAGPIGYGLSAAEGRTDRLAPHVRRSANIVLTLYVSYAVFGTVALWVAGMSPFDAINHAFTALSTGGFSTKTNSVAFWDSAVIEAVLIVLMILGTLNFLTVYTLLRGKFYAVYRNGELRAMLLQVAIAFFSVLFIVTLGVYATASRAIRVTIFEVISALSTCGLSITTYSDWNDFGWLVMVTLMLVGGGSGSTSGGIKQYRIYVIYKATLWEIRRAFMPPHAINEPTVWHGDNHHPLNDKQVRQVALFVGLYMAFFLIGSGMLTIYGYTMQEALFEFASSISGTGLSVGVTQPDMPVPVLWVQNLSMLMGRLEFFTIIVGLSKFTVDARTMFSNAAA